MPTIHPNILGRARRSWTDLSDEFGHAIPGALTRDQATLLEALARDAKDLLRRTEPRKAPAKELPAAARSTVAERRAARSAKTNEVRAFVVARAGGSCECGCGRVARDEPGIFRGELDHFWGGARKRASNTIGGTWWLALDCHRMKTSGRPTAEYWLEKWTKHCARHGYSAARPPLAKAGRR